MKEGEKKMFDKISEEEKKKKEEEEVRLIHVGEGMSAGTAVLVAKWGAVRGRA
jgi:hypothetical protein